MGLFVDFDPEEMMLGMEENLDDPDLEAELAAITGNEAAPGGRPRQKGKGEHISFDLLLAGRLKFLVGLRKYVT